MAAARLYDFVSDQTKALDELMSKLVEINHLAAVARSRGWGVDFHVGETFGTVDVTVKRTMWAEWTPEEEA